MMAQPISPILTFPLEGIHSATSQFETHAEAIAKGSFDPQDFAGLIVNRRAVEANVAVIRTADKMMGTLLDAVA